MDWNLLFCVASFVAGFFGVMFWLNRDVWDWPGKLPGEDNYRQ